jgi:UDP-glucose 4-epimerase
MSRRLTTPDPVMDHGSSLRRYACLSSEGIASVRVLVTGGAGFIGANLSAGLCADDGIGGVTVLDDLSTGRLGNLEGLEVEFVEGSILDTETLDQVMDGVGAVVHLAARPSVPRSLEDPMATHTVNATGTMAVLEAARRAGNPHVVVASSSSVYGANPVIPKSEDLATLPMSPYAASKLATEAYALSYQHSFDLPVLAFRLFNVFGPLQAADHAYAAVVPKFAASALRGDPLVVHGDGQQTRDFTSVETVSRVIAAAIRRRVTRSEPVNLAFGTRTNLLDLITLLERLFGHPLSVDHVAARPGDVRHSQADSTQLRDLFPEIEPVDLETALRTTLEWYRSASCEGSISRAGR